MHRMSAEEIKQYGMLYRRYYDAVYIDDEHGQGYFLGLLFSFQEKANLTREEDDAFFYKWLNNR